MPSHRALGLLLVGAGVVHAVAPRIFRGAIPPELPGSAETWIYASGAVEALTGAAVLHPRTRRAGAWAAAGLFVAVLPGNVQMWRRERHRPGLRRAILALRLPGQVPLVWWAIGIARGDL